LIFSALCASFCPLRCNVGWGTTAPLGLDTNAGALGSFRALAAWRLADREQYGWWGRAPCGLHIDP
jgi:hypothetical protein